MKIAEIEVTQRTSIVYQVPPVKKRKVQGSGTLSSTTKQVDSQRRKINLTNLANKNYIYNYTNQTKFRQIDEKIDKQKEKQRRSEEEEKNGIKPI